jgi:hypothetical protein
MNAYEYLQRKGVRKVHQPQKKYNLSVGELIQFLEEFARVKTVELKTERRNTIH